MLGLSLAAATALSCAAIAGFEDDYTVGDPGTGTAGTSTGTAGTSTGTAGTSTGTAGTTTGTAGTTTGTATGTAGTSGGTQTGGTGGGTQTGGTGGSTQTGGSGQGGSTPTWQVIDSFDVPINGTTVYSSVTLQSGTTYRLRASGHFDCMNVGAQCDAEYVDRSGTPDDFGGGTYDFGIGIDSSQVSSAVAPYWGAHQPSHVYEVDWQGAGAPISAKLWDPDYSNNSGSALHIEVLAFQ
jgi:hypothetical protein